MAGSALTRPTLRGLVIPEPLICAANLDADESSYTEAGPRVGVAVAQDDSAMVLDASGTQSAGGTLEVRTQRAGMPAGQEASFVWRAGAAQDWRGWNPPWIFDDWAWINRSTTADKWHHPHAVTLDDGTLLVAVVQDLRYVVAYTVTTANAATPVTVFDHGSTGTYSMQPTLVRLPSGRILCFFWREIDATHYQVQMEYSDDNGATWSTGARACLPASVGATPRRLRGAYANDQVLLLAWRTNGTSEEITQYASADLGCSFTAVETRSDTDRGYPEIAVVDNVFVCAWIGGGLTLGSTATYVPIVSRIASAFQALSTAEQVLGVDAVSTTEYATVGGGIYTDGELTLALDEDGCLYLLGRSMSSQLLYFTRSTDGGVTWSGLELHVFRLWDDAGTYLTEMSMTFSIGRVAVLSTNVATPATSGPSLSIVWGGGYTSQPCPLDTDEIADPANVSGWDVVYAPFDKPGDLVTWTKTATGAATETLTSSGLQLDTTSPDTIYYSKSLTITHADGIDVEARLNPSSSVSAIELRISDATPLQYEVRVQISTTGLSLYDIGAGATVGSVTTTLGAGLRVRVSVRGSAAVLAYRTTSTDWTEITCTALTGTAANAGGRLRWGTITGATSSVIWRYLAYNNGDSIVGRTAPDNFLGRWYGPAPVSVDDGVKIQARGGFSYQGEGWDIAARYDYPIENLFTTARSSRRQVWRSATDAADQEIVWRVDGQGEPLMQSPLLAVSLLGANFSAAEIWGKTLLGAWTKIGDISLVWQSGLKFTRAGTRVLCDTSGGSAVPDYLYRNALKGGHFRLAAGQVRAIESNSDGVWNASATAATSRITLSGVQITDDASGSGGQIWLRDVVALIPYTTSYTWLKLKIPTITTAEGYFTCKLMVGAAYVWGSEYGLPWARELKTYVETTEGRTGIRSMRQTAPPRYAVEVSWPDGVDTSGIAMEEPPTPSWVVGWSGGTPTANYGDTPYSVPGLLEELQGAVTPVVVFRGATLPASSTTVSLVKNPALIVYGSIVTDTLRVDNVIGTEAFDEFLRVGTVRVEELT